MKKQKCRLFVYLSTLIFCMQFCLPAPFAGIPEPGIIYYGKILDENQNLLTNGILNLTLSNQSGSTSVSVKTELKTIVDGDNTYSYSVLIPVETSIPGYPASENTLPFSETTETYYRKISIENTDIQKTDTISISADDIGTAKHMNVYDNAILPVVELSKAVQSVNEDIGNVSVSIILDVTAIENIMVPFTVSGTSDNQDHQLIDGTITIIKGQSVANLTVPVINDNVAEPDETIIITMGEVTNAQWGNTTIHVITIVDDDTTMTDNDNDGIPDQWEYSQFGNLTTANAYSDFDRDGYLDKIEYQFASRYDLNGALYDPQVPNAPGDEEYIAYNLDVDANGKADGGTDGLLLIRYLFENRGDNLIKGVVSGDCNRCSVEAIETYLTIIKSTILDVDGNGKADGGTDGLLLIRYLFENRGDNLVKGVVASDCNRCTATEIEQYLEEIKE